MASKDHQGRLLSWKAIARYLNCSVRTARRWEQEEALPVHRHHHTAQATVSAVPHELDSWLALRSSRTQIADLSPPSGRRVENTAKASGRIVIVVLPFEYLGSDSAHSHLADGLTEELITSLSRIPSLQVISRTSSLAVKARGYSTDEIGRALCVSHLVEGTLRLHGGQLRVATRLIDTESDRQLWGEQFAGSIDDVFTVQEQIAACIVARLRLHLTQEEVAQLSSHALPDTTAWQLLVRARLLAMRWQYDTIKEAITLLDRALTEAGEHAELLAARGRVLLQYREAGWDLSDGPLEGARECVARAAACDPRSTSLAQLRGWIAYSSGELENAINHLEEARSVDFSNPDTLVLLAYCLLNAGQEERAQPHIERLLSIDPLAPLNRSLPGWRCILVGRFDDALPHYRQMFDMDRENPMARLFLAWVLSLNGEHEAARELSNWHDENHPAAALGQMLRTALEGKTPGEPAPALAQQARQSEMFARLLFEIYALAKDYRRASLWLSVAIERGFMNYPYLHAHHLCRESWRGSEVEEVIARLQPRWQRLRDKTGG